MVASATASWLCAPAAFAAVADPPAAPAQAGDPSGVASDDAVAYANLRQLMREARFAEAESAARATLQSLETAGRGSTLHAAAVTEWLMYSLLSQSDMPALNDPETLVLAQRQVQLRQSTAGVAPAEVAHSLTTLARIHLARSEMDEADRAARQSLSILESAYGSRHADLADVTKFIGQVYMQRGDYASAKHWLERAMQIIEYTAGPQSVPMADILMILAQCQGALRETAQAIANMQRSVEVFAAARGPQHPDVGMSLTLLAQIQREDGQLKAAQDNLQRAMVILEAAHGPDSPVLVFVLSTIGLTLTDLGEYVAAAEAFERGMRIYDSDAAMVNNYGLLRALMGDSSGAIALFDRARSMWEQDAGPDFPDIAFAVENKGIELARQGKFDEARSLFKSALDIRRKAFGPDHLFVADSLDNLAGLDVQAGDAVGAERFASLALQIKERSLAPDSLLLAPSVMHLSHAAHLRGEIDAALQHANRVLEIQEASLGSGNPQVAETREWIAFLLAQAGDLRGSLESALRGEEAGREHLLLATRAFSEGESLRYAAIRPSGIDLLVTLAATHPDCCADTTARVLDSVIRARALTLDEMTTRHRVAADAVDGRGKALSQQLSEASRRLARLVVLGPADEGAAAYLELLEQAREARLRAEQDLAAHSASFRNGLSYRRIGATDVVAAVPDGAALVAYVRYTPAQLQPPPKASPAKNEPAYAAFVLSGPGAAPAVLDLGPAKKIESLIQRTRASVTQEMLAGGRASASSERAYRSAAQQLRRLIWDPVIARAGHPRTVFIVPDGSINLMDLAALPAGTTAYLAEAGLQLHYLSAERDLVVEPLRRTAGSMLALGGPDFDRGRLAAAVEAARAPGALPGQAERPIYRGPRAACGDFRKIRFDPLPATSKEVREVAGIWQGSQTPGTSLPQQATVLVGSMAGESEFKRQAGDRQVLHLATHGFFLGGDCGSALAAGAGGSIVTRENPLLLSGLVLAGANHRAAAGPDEEDGILTAEEIGTLDLQGTEWAVLSACDTGSGEIRAGEGVFGLQRAFRMAGARTTIMSLWPVEDDAARRWMSALYRHHFAEGRTTVESVNRANLELLAERRAQGLSTHPFYWAGFVASGDWR